MAALVLGAGGLGCEALHLLALQTSIHRIDIIDYDLIELSNLNRQMYYGQAEVGQSKALVAAAKLEPLQGKKVTGHAVRMEAMEIEFYRQFDTIYCCLDNLEGRRWINLLILSNRLPCLLIEGGTEGWQGHVRWIFGCLREGGPCLECTLGLHTSTNRIPLCTLHAIPTHPDHCIQWAMLQSDDLPHIHRLASERAIEFDVEPFTEEYTGSVVRGIIPAIAPTNALIAGIMCLAPHISINYAYWNGDGSHLWTGLLERDPACPVCLIEPTDQSELESL